jgi:hypothetical protein
MSRWLLPLALTASVAGGLACRWAVPEKEGNFRLINADALVALQADTAHPVHIYDANHDDFRKKEGIIGGAVLLKDHDFDVASTLPADKSAPLVFYCSNTR